MKKSKKPILMSIIAIIILLLAVGISYAAWNMPVWLGSLTSSLSSEGIELEFLESSSEIINVSNTLTMKDQEGINQDEYFAFAVTSKTRKDEVIGYNLSIEKLTVDTGYTAFNDNDIKIYLTDYDNGEVLLAPTYVSSLTNYKFYSNVHIHDSSTYQIQDKFKLRAWVVEDNVNVFTWDENTKLQYKFRINLGTYTPTTYTATVNVTGGTVDKVTKQVVEGTNAIFEVTPSGTATAPLVSCTNNQIGEAVSSTIKIKNISNDTTCTVTFEEERTVLYSDGTLIINERASDISSNTTEHGEATNTYAAMKTIGTDADKYIFSSNTGQPWNSQKASITSVEIGRKISPTYTKFWFFGLKKMTTGDFTNLDTSRVTSMLGMFSKAGYDSSVTSFTLTGLNTWDTSNVTHMNHMFSYAGYYATSFNLDLSSWDTSSLKSLYWTFYSTGNNSTSFDLNLLNWNTSKVEAMQHSFARAGRMATTWSIRGLSNWDTSKVTNMFNAFSSSGYSAETFSLNLSNWNTSSVTNMSGMFSDAGYNATTWSIGDISSWNTSSVTNMQDMFEYAGYNSTTFDIGTLKVYATNISSMFNGCRNAKAIVNIYSNPPVPTGTTDGYYQAFYNAATASGSGITVNYSSTTTNIDDIIATGGSRIVKGVQLD